MALRALGFQPKQEKIRNIASDAEDDGSGAMCHVFFVASSFSQSIGRWHTSQVCDISSLNQSIGGRNTSQICGVRLMFAEDSSFY